MPKQLIARDYVMPCDTMLCYFVICFAISCCLLRYADLCCTVLCYAVSCYVMPRYTLLCYFPTCSNTLLSQWIAYGMSECVRGSESDSWPPLTSPHLRAGLPFTGKIAFSTPVWFFHVLVCDVILTQSSFWKKKKEKKNKKTKKQTPAPHELKRTREPREHVWTQPPSWKKKNDEPIDKYAYQNI